MSELPIPCHSCHEENMVDMEKLETRRFDNVAFASGFVCSKCGAWVQVSYTTLSLDMALVKLASRSPQSIGYHWRFAKALKKSEGVQEKYGCF
jgi:hypothetical protein